MNARPDPSALQNFGAPPQPTGHDRLKSILLMTTGGGFIFMLGLYAAQVVLPEKFAPAHVAGDAAGMAEKADIQAKSGSQIAYQSGLAAGVAAAQARQQARTDALQTQIVAANVADASCLAGTVIRSLGWETTGDGLQRVGAGMQVACGMGDAFRDNIAQSQAEAAGMAAPPPRAYSASMIPNAPPPQEPQRSAPDLVFDADRALEHEARLPANVRAQLKAGAGNTQAYLIRVENYYRANYR